MSYRPPVHYPPPWDTILRRVIARARPRFDLVSGDEEAVALLWEHYVTAPHCAYDQLAHGSALLEAVLDTALMCGRRRTNRWLQEAVNWRIPSAGLAVDGVLGPMTRAELGACEPGPIVAWLVAARLRFDVGSACQGVPRELAEPILDRIERVRDLLVRAA